jgi:hypothetical protein
MANPEVLAALSAMKMGNAFPGFIDYIRFPRFRNLETNARIDFELLVDFISERTGTFGHATKPSSNSEAVRN